ncbi:MAG TPA: UDP-N-acetylmuramate dehydrogenase [Nitrospiria bacterium]|nr:UDP-N-acetylmuramate dehydrogenase [Nitrospiria bacterium]
MRKKNLKQVFKGISGEVRWNEPLSRHTTLKIGGPAEALYFPRSREALGDVLRRARRFRIPVFVLGGSNILVRDGGVRGIVLKLNGFQKLTSGENRVQAGGGVLLSRLSRYAFNQGLGGAEFAQGIPGTVGGAVTMNAGTREGDMAGILASVQIIDPGGSIQTLQRGEIQFGYRWSRLPKGVVIEAEFKLRPRNRAEIRRKMETFMVHRKKTQPLAWPNAGSVFKNPEGGYAANLIERLHLKGARVGEAQVSDQHANFIVNRGGATAKDVLGLIRTIGRKVEDRTGITLELELRVVGHDAA